MNDRATAKIGDVLMAGYVPEAEAKAQIAAAQAERDTAVIAAEAAEKLVAKLRATVAALEEAATEREAQLSLLREHEADVARTRDLAVTEACRAKAEQVATARRLAETEGAMSALEQIRADLAAKNRELWAQVKLREERRNALAAVAALMGVDGAGAPLAVLERCEAAWRAVIRPMTVPIETEVANG